MKFASVFFLMIASFAAHAETIKSVENATYDVGRVEAVSNVQIPGFESLVRVAGVERGGAVTPVGIYVFIWDPAPITGGDFGTLKAFDLGNFSDDARVAIAVNSYTYDKSKKDKNNGILTLVLDTSTTLDGETIVAVRLKLVVKIVNGLVADTLDMTKTYPKRFQTHQAGNSDVD